MLTSAPRRRSSMAAIQELAGTVRAHRILAALALLVAALAVILLARSASTVWSCALTGRDEPAHFVTGVMVRDYLLSFPWQNPLAFAESFYVRYPKVAIGHWPPVYYGIQAVWYLVFDVSLQSARALSLVILAVLVALFWLQSRRSFGWAPATLAASCLLLVPLVQKAASMVMSDLLTSLFVALALWAFSNYLTSASWRHAAAFALFAAAAILTKGNAWVLGAFAIVAPLAAREWRCYLRWSYLLSGIAVLAACVPFYWFASVHSVGYADNPVDLAAKMPLLSDRVRQILPALGSFSIIVWLTAAAVATSSVLAAWRSSDRRTDPLHICAAVWVVCQIAFLLVFPMTLDPRYFLLSAVPLFFLFGDGIVRCSALFRQSGVWKAVPERALQRTREFAPLLLVATSLLGVVQGEKRRVDGYDRAAQAIPAPPGGVVILCALGERGEGAFIAERLLADPRHDGVVLRATKVLSDSAWNGQHYRSLFQSPAQMVEYLQSVPLEYLILNEKPETPDQRLLLEVVRAAPERYELAGRFPVSDSFGLAEPEILVYRNRDKNASRPAVIRLNMGESHGSRVLEWRMRGRSDGN